MNEAGNNPRNLTNSPKADSNPSWSPDKQQIVFQRSSRAQGGILDEKAVAASDIYLMSASGQNLRQLTNHPADDRDPSWSPDGRLIAFVSARNGEDGEEVTAIYIMDTSGNSCTSTY